MGETGARDRGDRRDAGDAGRGSRWGRDAEPGQGVRGDDRRLPAGPAERSRGQERGDRPRGLARACRGVPSRDIIAYIGPGIGARRYEVGEDVRRAFVGGDPAAAKSFAPRQDGKYLADLYGLARQRLAAAGVAGIHGGGFCTASEERFFSFRRDQTTGRMASLIWLEDS